MYIMTKKELGNNMQDIAISIMVDEKIVYTTLNDRRIGKTQLILKMADMFGLPVVTGSWTAQKCYMEMAMRMGLKVDVYFMGDSCDGFRGSSAMKQKILVDETITPAKLASLQQHFTVAGFMRGDV